MGKLVPKVTDLRSNHNMCERADSFDDLYNFGQRKGMGKGKGISMFEIKRNKGLRTPQA